MTHGLDTAGMLQAPTRGQEEQAAPDGSGFAFSEPPPPPPPPVRSRRELRNERKEIDRTIRTDLARDVARRARKVWRGWWFLLAGFVGVLLVSWFVLWLVRSLAEAVRVEPAQQTAPQVVRVRSMPNPFDAIKLTKQAAVFLGAHDTDGDGMVDTLDDAKSSVALAAILRQTDLCGWFVSIDASFNPVLSRQSSPGAVQLAECAGAASSTPTPPTTVAPTSTTVAPTTTTVGQ